MHKYLTISIFLVLIFSYKTCAQTDTSLTFSEIMFAPSASNSEFVEIYNTSETDTISLNSLAIKYYTSKIDYITIYSGSKFLPPLSFAVILEGDYDFENGIYKDLIPSGVTILKTLDKAFGSSGMSNSTDRNLILMNSLGQTLDEYTYSADNSTGFSDEKIILNKGNETVNWSNSLVKEGTPGTANSVSPFNYDLLIKNIQFNPEQQFVGSALNINFIVKNIGINQASSFSVSVFDDINFDSSGILKEEIYFNEFSNLTSSDSLTITVTVDSLSDRNYQFIIKIDFEADENTLDNYALINFTPLTKPAGFNDIVINEIMYKPTNDEPEWIEIFNNSPHKINLRNWYFGDRNSKVKIADTSLFIEPERYIVISEDETVVNFYDVVSAPIVLKLPSLNNSGDDLYIYDVYENTVDSVLYLSLWGGDNGHSLERINITDSSNSPSNWATANTKLKATPGKINSVSPKNYDLTIKNFSAADGIVFSPDNIKISTDISNNGLSPVALFVLNFYNDLNKDSVAQQNEMINTIAFNNLRPGETEFYSFDYNDYKQGVNSLIAEVVFEDDEFPENNFAFTDFNSVKINEVRNDIIINEFMPAPNSGEGEWIEIYNKSGKQINLMNYKIADERDTAEVINEQVILNTGEYFLIINDSSFFDKYKSSGKYTISKFPSLNNSSDKIILLDSLNRIIDSLQYTSEWNVQTGKSLERINPGDMSASPENWAVSKNINGGSPGEINSVTQKNYDVGIIKIIFNPAAPFYGDTVSIHSIVKNYGNKNAEFKIILFDENEIIESSNLINLALDDSIDYMFVHKIEELDSQNNFTVKIEFVNDQDSTNNFLTSSIKPGYRQNSIIVNEIMFTPQNGAPEWVEIYNDEDYKIDLSGWSISDILTNPVSTEISETYYFIEPKSFLVITKDSIIINYHDVIPSKILTVPFANLNNSEDGIVIKDIYGNLIDSVHYTSNWQTKTGYSIERISINVNSNDSSNWAPSFDIEQSTPGRLNSASQKTYDLAIAAISIFPQMPKYGETININVVIKNTGLLEANSFSVKFYTRENNHLLNEINIAALAKNDSIKLTSVDYKLFEVTEFFVEINLPLDGNFADNKDTITVVPGFEKNEILINEVMFNPDNGKPEWIEFVNNTNHEINLLKWSISDILPSPKIDFITNNQFTIFPGQYFIVSSDTALFRTNFNTEASFFQASFGALGNSEDGIVIYDYYKNLIDSLFYDSEFGSVKGNSIERLSLSDVTNDINNWGISINVNGSSPGFANSVSESQNYKRDQVIINEIMYDPNENNSEFIEFYNNSNETVELGGWILDNGKEESFRIINASYQLLPESYFLISADSSIFPFYSFNGDETFINVLNKSGLGLTNDEQTLILKDLKGNLIDSIKYSSKCHNPNIIETKNKSLERLNPKIDSNEPSNWSTSANLIGATPGKQNSIFTDNKIHAAGLTITPNPFSPDNDGFEDFCAINYSLGISLSQVRIKIFDSKGRLVRTLLNNQPSGSTGSVIFDGLNENRSPLKIGIYIIYFEATNAQTGQQEILKDVVVVARKL